jgi:hypothetical protein
VTAGFFLGAIAIALAGLLPHRTARPGAPKGAASLGLVAALCAVVALLFLAQLHAIEIAAATQVPYPAAYANLPVVPINESPPAYGHTPPWVANTMLGLSVAESGALIALYLALRGRKPPRGALLAIGLASAAMLAAALRTWATTSQDLYLYVGFAHLGSAAYLPPAVPFAGEFRAVNELWGLPMLPAAYGPLWIALSRATLLAGPTLAAQVEAFRCLGALCFVASAALVFALRRDAGILALFALNPALVEQYVADGHNDILALALVLGAFLAVRRNVTLALGLVVAAGATKLPFALLGGLAFATLPQPRLRLLPAALALLLALGATLLFSGGRYFAAAAHVMNVYIFDNGVSAATRFAAATVALVALVAALALRRFDRGASWSFLAFGTELFPWYVGWGIPYALLENSWLAVYLLSLPLVAFNLTTVYAPTPLTRAAYGLLMLAALIPLLQRRRETREARPARRRTPGL